MNFRLLAVAMGIAGAICGAGQAFAATMTYSYDAMFSTGPMTDITGTVTVDYQDATSSMVTGFTSSLSAAYQPYDFQSYGTFLYVCNNPLMGGGCEVDAGQNQFYFVFNAQQGNPPVNISFAYSAAGEDNFYNADSVTFGPSTVPLPASAPMFGAALAALGLVGFGLRWRKDAAAA